MNGEQLVANLLLDLRSHMSMFLAGSEIAMQRNDAVPGQAMTWLTRWSPYIESLQAEEETYRKELYSEDNEEKNWEALIDDLGHKLEDISLAQVELQNLQRFSSPESAEWKLAVNMAFDAVERLNQLKQRIQSGYFRQYLD